MVLVQQKCGDTAPLSAVFDTSQPLKVAGKNSSAVAVFRHAWSATHIQACSSSSVSVKTTATSFLPSYLISFP